MNRSLLYPSFVTKLKGDNVLKSNSQDLVATGNHFLPEIVFVAGQLCGKSAVVNRVLGMDILPEAESTVSIRIRLRHHIGDSAEASIRIETLEVAVDGSKQSLQISTCFGICENIAIAGELKKAVEAVGGYGTTTITNREVVVHIESENVCDMDLVDMPFLVRSPPEEMKVTCDLVSRLQVNDDHRLYVCVADGGTRLNGSTALKEVKGTAEQPHARAVCVVTNFDSLEVTKKPAAWRDFENMVPNYAHPTFICTAMTFKPSEEAYFADESVLKVCGDLVSQGRATFGSLISRIDEHYKSCLQSHWLPPTLFHLLRLRDKVTRSGAAAVASGVEPASAGGASSAALDVASIDACIRDIGRELFGIKQDVAAVEGVAEDVDVLVTSMLRAADANADSQTAMLWSLCPSLCVCESEWTLNGAGEPVRCGVDVAASQSIDRRSVALLGEKTRFIFEAKDRRGQRQEHSCLPLAAAVEFVSGEGASVVVASTVIPGHVPGAPRNISVTPCSPPGSEPGIPGSPPGTYVIEFELPVPASSAHGAAVSLTVSLLGEEIFVKRMIDAVEGPATRKTREAEVQRKRQAEEKKQREEQAAADRLKETEKKQCEEQAAADRLRDAEKKQREEQAAAERLKEAEVQRTRQTDQISRIIMSEIDAPAHMWAKELQALGDVGFTDMLTLLPLLQQHLEGPVSHRPELKGQPSPEGMQRVIQALLIPAAAPVLVSAPIPASIPHGGFGVRPVEVSFAKAIFFKLCEYRCFAEKSEGQKKVCQEIGESLRCLVDFDSLDRNLLATITNSGDREFQQEAKTLWFLNIKECSWKSGDFKMADKTTVMSKIQIAWRAPASVKNYIGVKVYLKMSEMTVREEVRLSNVTVVVPKEAIFEINFRLNLRPRVTTHIEYEVTICDRILPGFPQGADVSAPGLMGWLWA